MNLTKTFSCKNIWMLIVTYSVFIITFLTGFSHILPFRAAKCEIYIIFIVLNIILFFVLKKIATNRILLKVYVCIVLIGCVFFTFSDFKKICIKGITYKEFFFNYFERFETLKEYTYINTILFTNKINDTLKINIDKINKFEGKVLLQYDRKLYLFDFISEGLAAQEESFIWTDGNLVKIPFYADKNILKGNFIIKCECYGQEKEVEVFVDYRYLKTVKIDYLNDEIIIPFNKEESSEVILVELYFNDSIKSPSESGLWDDKRKLGLSLKSIELSNIKKYTQENN